MKIDIKAGEIAFLFIGLMIGITIGIIIGARI